MEGEEDIEVNSQAFPWQLYKVLFTLRYTGLNIQYSIVMVYVRSNTLLEARLNCSLKNLTDPDMSYLLKISANAYCIDHIRLGLTADGFILPNRLPIVPLNTTRIYERHTCLFVATLLEHRSLASYPKQVPYLLIHSNVTSPVLLDLSVLEALIICSHKGKLIWADKDGARIMAVAKDLHDPAPAGTMPSIIWLSLYWA